MAAGRSAAELGRFRAGCAGHLLAAAVLAASARPVPMMNPDAADPGVRLCGCTRPEGSSPWRSRSR